VPHILADRNHESSRPSGTDYFSADRPSAENNTSFKFEIRA
jgi:hypothetical protein